jgi:hypothetical protein
VTSHHSRMFMSFAAHMKFLIGKWNFVNDDFLESNLSST